MDRSASASVAGYGVHSSKIMTMSLPRSRWMRMDVSGSRNTLSPFTGDLKATPSSVTFRSASKLNT